MALKVKDPVSGLTHSAGVLLSITGLVILVYLAAIKSSVWHIVSFSIYGTSMILLYMASSLYHLLSLTPKKNLLLRKIDHIMIFLLIAGTYTPITLIALRGIWGWSIFGIVWALAIAGVVVKIFFLNAPRLLSTFLYLGMGWLIVVAIFPLTRTVPPGGLILLLAGGMLYSIGALLYALKWPGANSRYFGFHEIFHLFVLGGSLCHFWLMLKYIMYL